MVDAAADTGCDAIKIQTYTADTITLDVDRPEFKIHGGLWDGRSLYELYQEAQTPFEWHAAIFERWRSASALARKAAALPSARSPIHTSFSNRPAKVRFSPSEPGASVSPQGAAFACARTVCQNA